MWCAATGECNPLKQSPTWLDFIDHLKDWPNPLADPLGHIALAVRPNASRCIVATTTRTTAANAVNTRAVMGVGCNSTHNRHCFNSKFR